MSESKTNRREFLGVTAASLAALAVVSGPLKLTETLAAPLARKPPVEEWLLSTGQSRLNPVLYNQILARIRSLQG